MSDLGKFIGGFGEQFVKTLESDRKRKKEEDQFNQDMAYKYRQQNLMMGLYQQRQDLDREQSFVDVKKDDVYNKIGVPEGKYHTSLIDNVINAYNKTGEKITPKKFSKLEPLYGGMLETQYQEGQEEPLSYGTLYKPEKGIEGGQGGGGKEPKLTEAGATGLANLKSPNLVENNTYMTPEKAKNVFQRSLQALTKDVLGSRASNWFYNISERWGRVPTADELDKEIVKHYEGKNKTLTDVDVEQLNRLVEYLETAEEGIKKYRTYEDKIKKLSEKND